jgi:hypothetical protein
MTDDADNRAEGGPDSELGVDSAVSTLSIGPTATALLGLACLGVATFAAVTSWGALAGSHPAYGVVLVVLWLIGLGLLVAAMILSRRPGNRSRWWSVAALPVVLLLIVAVYLRPFPADDRAIGIIELSSQPGSLGLRGGIRVRSTPTHLLMSPADTGDAPIGTGLVFYPGARVDPRAYATLLAPVVEAGHPVVVVKPPLGFALLDINAATGAVEAYDAWSEVQSVPVRWAVGGHSLGGVAASDYAHEVAISDVGGPASDVAGLVLWAAYPARSLADTDLPVLSVSGTNDALTTPAEIEQSKELLPLETDFVVIEGANHSQFGDYGDQSGDGEATVSDEEARTRIVEATIRFLDQLDDSD